MLTFLLNDDEIRLTECGASDTLLDFLRIGRRLTGTKEGCAEGDCGACTVLLGRLHEGRLVYEPVNACIRFLASCHGCHVVTVEHLRDPDGGLHAVQRAMVDHHASQCGFCTPGFVMALYGLWMTNPAADVTAIETALQGNLCRCTGYAPIVRAAQAVLAAGGQAGDRIERDRAAVTARLAAMQGARVEVARDGADRAILPADVDDLAAVLDDHPDATIVAGATDVGLWVTKALRPIAPAVFIGHLDGLKRIEVGADHIRIGAGVTYTEAAPLIDAEFPEVSDYWHRIGGWQVRNMGTIGGNIANGSPIGETPPLMIALGARLVLRRGAVRRDLPLEDFFIAYGQQDIRPGEFVETIVLPRRGDALVAAYKISKRQSADISAVAAAFRIEVAGGVIASARIGFGGMAGTPRRAAAAEAALTGAPFSAASFAAAGAAVQDDFQPLDDWRASAAYRRAIARNFFRRFWLEQAGGDQPVRLARAAGD